MAGVSAIAFTLLVVDIAVPVVTTDGDTAAELVEELLALWPSLLAYLIGFMTIGV